MSDSCVVFYESWQMECCGTPFSTGSKVCWPVCKSDGNNPNFYAVDSARIDYEYDAHDCNYDAVHHVWPDLLILEGIVENIDLVYHQYAPSQEDPHCLVPIAGKTIVSQRAEGFEEKLGNFQISGYLVRIVGYQIRKPKQNEPIID